MTHQFTQQVLKGLTPSPHPWVVTGVSGQIGKRVLEQAALIGQKIIVLNRSDFDLSKPSQLGGVMSKLPAVSGFIHCAAYTAVDLAESDYNTCMNANGHALKPIADFCLTRNIPLVFFSTDYVYPGTGTQPYSESDPTAPLSVYGKSKRLGEQIVESSGCHYSILRTSWVFDSKGTNFLNTMLKFGAERQELSLVNDQIGAPSFAPHLASAALSVGYQMLGQNAPRSGVYHCVNLGETSWYGFAEEIFKTAKENGLALKVSTLKPVSTEQFPRPAPRPKNSRLSSMRIQKELGLCLPHWKTGVTEALSDT